MIFSYKVNRTQSIIEYLQSFQLSKEKINYFLNNNCIVYQNEIIKDKNYCLEKGMVIQIDSSYYDKNNVTPVCYNLHILYEDDYLLVVDKPYGEIIYDLNGGVGIDNYVSYYYQSKGYDLIPRHLQRLDKDTTGCIVYCKDLLTLSKLSFDLENNNIEKTYHAVCEGIIKKDFIVDKPLGTNRHVNGQMVISKNGKPSKTEFHVLKNENGKTLLACRLITGRKHQIRVHLQSVGHPIIGDVLYNRNKSNSRMMLNCYSISFYHPISNVKFLVISQEEQVWN